MQQANLAGADLAGADITAAFNGANLTGANLAYTHGTPDFTDADLTNLVTLPVFPDAQALAPTDGYAAYADLTGANFSGATLTGADLSYVSANCSGLRSGGIVGTPTDLPTGWMLHDGYLFCSAPTSPASTCPGRTSPAWTSRTWTSAAPT